MVSGYIQIGFIWRRREEPLLAGASSSQILNYLFLDIQKDPAHEGEVFVSAETRGFEPPKDLTPYLISSEAHSTGLCDVSLNL